MSRVTVRTEEAPLPVLVQADVPHLALRPRVREQALPGGAGEGGGGGAGVDRVVQAGLPGHRLPQPVQGVS